MPDVLLLHCSVCAGAAELQAQLDDLQGQLQDTSAAFAAEHAALSEALAQAHAARDEARAAAAAAVAQLEGCKAQLAQAEAAQARAMAELQVWLRLKDCWVGRWVHLGLGARGDQGQYSDGYSHRPLHRRAHLGTKHGH